MAKKYIDADKLKAEIERRKEEYKEDRYMSNYRGQIAYYKDEIYDDLLHFIDSLKQEQSCDTCTNDKGCVTCKDGELWEGKEQPSEDLEEAAEKYAYRGIPEEMKSKLKPIGDEVIKNFKVGAEWQKAQMLKDAVEGFIFQSADYYPKQLIAGYDGELGMGDKVKIAIIPIKEDKK